MPAPMTLVEKLQALTKLAEQGRNGDVYAGIEFLLRTRGWPEWLNSVAASIDRPVNLENDHV